MKVIHIINSLKKGGAEGNLYRLCKYHKKKYQNRIEIIIITLIKNGHYVNELKRIGVKIISLNISSKFNFLFFIKKIFELRKFIKSKNPDIIQSWMYHSNFITLFLPRIFYDKIFWNIRHSELNTQISKKTTIFISKICGLFSKVVPKKIIYCSEESIKFHQDNHFYFKKKPALINNGYSDKSYFPSKLLYSKFRKKNNLKNSDIILGYAGRYAKQKNIHSILFAFSKIVKNYKNIYLCMVGKNISIKNNELSALISDYKISEKVFLLKEQRNLVEFYNGIDLLVLASHSESFPNVVAEAMLCSTPVLSSNVGCSKEIINDCGFVINKNDYNSIFMNLNKIIKTFKSKKKKWKTLKKKSRYRIKKEYSVEKMGNNYFTNWVF